VIETGSKSPLPCIRMRVTPEKFFYPDSPPSTAIGPDWLESGGGWHRVIVVILREVIVVRGAASSVDAGQDVGQPLPVDTNIARVSESPRFPLAPLVPLRKICRTPVSDE